MEIENKESRPLGKFPYSFFCATPRVKSGETDIYHAEEWTADEALVREIDLKLAIPTRHDAF